MHKNTNQNREPKVKLQDINKHHQHLKKQRHKHKKENYSKLENQHMYPTYNSYMIKQTSLTPNENPEIIQKLKQRKTQKPSQ